MEFEKIDLENWSRKEIFDHYMNCARNTYSITVRMDVSRVIEFAKKHNYTFYSAFTWLVSKSINEHKQFRMGFDCNGNVGYYDCVHPNYPVLDKDENAISLSTEYSDSMDIFCQRMQSDIRNYEESGVRPKENENMIMISTLPWLHYENFCVNNESGQHFLFPMVAWGKYIREDSKMMMPVTLQISHAAADGYVCSKFFESLETAIDKLKNFGSF